MKVSSDSYSGGGFGDGDAWPPGFRFHPTDVELVLYYLKRKICKQRLKLDIISETDVYKWDPEELPGQSILKTGDRQWFFFSPRDRKYPNGARANRATRHGYWKATGKDRNICCNSRTAGVKKTLVYYKGRAPSGERTDWVMHEYTLDEDELKRCRNVKDYYALYKVFKKSGPGPKNGEQYGAPFREEDWAEDDNHNVNFTADRDVPSKQVNEVASDDNLRVNGHFEPSFIEIPDIMNQILDEPALNPPQSAYNAYVLPQVAGEQETQSTMVDPFTNESIFPEVHEFHLSGQQRDVQGSFDFTQSVISQLQLYEAPEVTSAPNTWEQEPPITEEDFLEVDDLIGAEPTFSNIEKPVEYFPKPVNNLLLEEIDGLCDFDLYHDAAMFLHEMGPIEEGAISNPYMNTFGSEMVNQVDYQCQTHHAIAAVSQTLSQLDYQVQPHWVGGIVPHSNMDPLWTHDQTSNVNCLAESNQGVPPLPNSGLVHESTNIHSLGNQNQNGEGGDGGAGWISSALWSFVESIPTTPASASENALVNRAFERMSSFSRVINVRNANVGAGNGGAANVRRADRSRSRGFFIFSVLGAVCAILWVMIGSSRIWETGLSWC